LRYIISKALLLILLTQTSWAIVYNINEDDYITNVSSPSFKYSVIYSTMSPPGIPAAGKGYTYLDTDKKIKFINSDGTIYDLTAAAAGGADNLGNHIATTTLIMGGFDITGAGNISATSVTSTATYATNAGALQGHNAAYFATSAGLSSYTPLTLTINEISALSTTYLGIAGKAADSDLFDGIDSTYFLNELSAGATTYVSSDYIDTNGTFIRFDPANDGDIQAEISESSAIISVPLHLGTGTPTYINGSGDLFVGDMLEVHGDQSYITKRLDIVSDHSSTYLVLNATPTNEYNSIVFQENGVTSGVIAQTNSLYNVGVNDKNQSLNIKNYVADGDIAIYNINSSLNSRSGLRVMANNAVYVGSGTPTYVTGSGDLYVAGDAEIDGNLYIPGTNNYITGEGITSRWYSNNTKVFESTGSSMTVNVPMTLSSGLTSTGEFIVTDGSGVVVGASTAGFATLDGVGDLGVEGELEVLSTAKFGGAVNALNYYNSNGDDTNTGYTFPATDYVRILAGGLNVFDSDQDQLFVNLGAPTAILTLKSYNTVFSAAGTYGTRQAEITPSSMTVNVPLYLGAQDLNIAEGKLADSTIISADIKDATITTADMTAATTGWFVNWANFANVPAGFADGIDNEGVGGGGASTLQVAIDGVEITSPTVSINLRNGFNGEESPEGTALICISTATPTNGDVTHIPNCDQVYDFATSGMLTMSLGVDDTTDGGLTLYGDNAKGCPTIKLYNSEDYDDTEEYWMLKSSGTLFTLGTADVETFKFYSAGNFSATGNVAGATYASNASVSDAELKYIATLSSNAQDQINGKQATVTEGSLADSVIVSADIKDATIALADLAAATTGWLTAWANLTEVPSYEPKVTEGSLADSVIVSADIKDGTIVAGDMTAATTGWFTNWANISNKAVVTGEITDGTIALADLAAATSGYLTNYDNLSNKILVGVNETFGSGWNSDTGVPEKDDIYDALGVEDFGVCISSPNHLTAGEGYQISKFLSYAVTWTTMTAICNDGTTFVCMLEQRAKASPNAAGTDIWSGDITVPATEWRGGTFADATVPANYGLFLVPTSWTGNITSLMIYGSYTRD